MLRPIPSRILQSTARVQVCTGVDQYQNQTYQEHTVSHVHCQPTNSVRKTIQNTDVVTSGVLFVDARLSSPSLDWLALLQSAHEQGGDMRVFVDGRGYTVQGVDELRDDENRLHHWEIWLV